MKVSKTTLLFIHTPDRSGELARVLEIIAKAKVNVLGYAGYCRDKRGHIMVVTEDNTKVMQLLKKADYEVRKEPVVVVLDNDTVGAASKVARKIADAGISLTGAFATGSGNRYLAVLQAENAGRLAAVLKK